MVNVELSNNEFKAIWAALIIAAEIVRKKDDKNVSKNERDILKKYSPFLTFPGERINTKPAMKQTIFQTTAGDFAILFDKIK